MSDPSPPRGLPEAEYIEIFTGMDSIRTKGWFVRDASGKTGYFPDRVFPPGQWIVLCSARDSALFGSSSVAIDPWPVLNNDKDEIIIRDDKGSVRDSVAYRSSWHIDSARNGGFSLSIVNLNYRCDYGLNWRTSLETDGGSPGVENKGIDWTKGEDPQITGAYSKKGSDRIVVWFNTDMDTSSFKPHQISIHPDLGLKGLNWRHRRLDISLMQPVVSDAILELKDSYSCSGSLASKIEVQISPAYDPQPMDLVINEVMFDPLPGEHDYLEIMNTSNHPVALEGVWFRKEDSADSVMIDSLLILRPENFLVFTTDDETLRARFPETQEQSISKLKLFNLPPDRAHMAIIFQGIAIDRIYYDHTFHHPALGGKRGVSLERRFYALPAIDRSNWASASHAVNFGTPGKENSQHSDGSPEGTIYLKEQLTGLGEPLELIYNNMMENSVLSLRFFTVTGENCGKAILNRIIGVTGTLLISADELGFNNPGLYLIWIEILSDSGRSRRYIRKVYVN